MQDQKQICKIYSWNWTTKLKSKSDNGFGKGFWGKES